LQDEQPEVSHVFEGYIEVEVIREADLFLDFEADNGFESAEIIKGNFVEIEYKPIYEGEEPLERTYTTCPDCARQINYLNDGEMVSVFIVRQIIEYKLV
jgi:hypothetical protein